MVEAIKLALDSAITAQSITIVIVKLKSILLHLISLFLRIFYRIFLIVRSDIKIKNRNEKKKKKKMMKKSIYVTLQKVNSNINLSFFPFHFLLLIFAEL